MPGDGPEQVTQLLQAWRNGDAAALDALVRIVYAELHRLARRHMGRQQPGHTLNSTALVNEAYLRLVNQQHVQWQNRAHFFAVAAQAMRNILIDMARRRTRIRHGGGMRQIVLDESLIFSEDRAVGLVALDDALTDLAKLDERRARIVELRYFGGLNIDETAEVLSLSPATVDREWRRARSWLYNELTSRSGGEADSASENSR